MIKTAAIFNKPEMKITYQIGLTKFEAEDFELYYLLVGNEQVMQMITERALLLSEARERYDTVLRKNELHPVLGYYKITEKKSGSFIGLAKMEILTKDASETELGYMLLPEYWGKGIGSTVAKKLMDYVFAEKTTKKITAIIDPKNTASRKILINNGFVSEKTEIVNGLQEEFLGFTVASENIG
ncbi:GNAT family N-acetyltransferase [Myroides ceti]|uniref:GNAT family N-acetyltransferase n=1 Tax=Paenimyroides ceti TaxID=395087 RepID=A0ABT8CQ04_9FLAO|nr:GNAT family N-acetyltransferase [Paenimyroides ceti]MDN3705831.1 GNAT family N-acetyltransferase [Paenimyroides ceti]